MNFIYKTIIPIVVIYTSLSMAKAGSKTAADAKRPNIIFMFSDDHAIKAISAYGSGFNKTPNIDRLALEGAVFTRNFVTNSICGPSRACVLTGKHSHINRKLGNAGKFNGSQMTFPKELQKAGYKTAIFGKWHLRSEPTGFDEWMVYPDQGHYYNPDYLTPEGKKTLEGYCVEVTTNLALDYLKKQTADKPFLLMCQFKAPHRRFMPGPNYLTKYDDVTFPEPDTLFDDYENRASGLKTHRMGIGSHMSLSGDLHVIKTGSDKGILERMNPQQRKAWHDAYGAKNAAFRAAKLKGKELVRWKYQRYIKDYLRCVAAVDDNVGRLLDQLDKSGLAENTIVVYSSDQGFYLGEHGWFDKRWMFEESLRQPLLIRWPGKIKPGTKVEKLTQNIDFAPTFIAAAGADIPTDVQGKNIATVIDHPDAQWRDSIYYHYYVSGTHGVPRHYGVRTKRYKLIHFYTTNEWNLIDLKRDPNELKSFYNDPQYKDIQEQLHAELDKLIEQYGAESTEALVEKFKNGEPKKKPKTNQ